MSLLRLRVKKSGRKNPITKKLGTSARVLTNGTADFDDIVKEAGHNTTMHKAELRMAFELGIEATAEMLKQGYIVDLGPLGKLYPSCSSGWYEKEEDLKLSDVKPTLYYRPSEEVEAAIKGAKLVWAKAGEDDGNEEEEEPGGASPEPSQGGGNSGGTNTGDNTGGNTGGGTGTIDTGGGGNPSQGGENGGTTGGDDSNDGGD